MLVQQFEKSTSDRSVNAWVLLKDGTFEVVATIHFGCSCSEKKKRLAHLVRGRSY